MIRIQRRDKDLMSTLSKFGVLSTEQIQLWCFPGVDRHTTLRRLRVLEKHGLILNPSTLPNGMKTWSLAQVGANLISAPAPFRYSNRNATLHDVTLSTLRKHLEETNIAHDWTSDMEMKRELGKNSSESIVPDGLFLSQVFHREAVVALELELHAKSHKRYRSIFYDYSYRSAISHIFYVVKSLDIIKPIITSWVKVRRDMRHKPDQELLFCVYNEIISSSNDTKIYVSTNLNHPLLKVFKNYQSCPRESEFLVQPLGNKTMSA